MQRVIYRAFPQCLSWVAVVLAVWAVPWPGRGMTFNVTYDASVNALTNAAQVKTAFAAATQTLQNEFTNPITINIVVYWGSTGPFSGGIDLGASSTEYYGFYTYAQITNALQTLRSSLDDSNAVASLPGTDPVATNKWLVPLAEGRAMGLPGIARTDTNIDGSVGFAADVAYTFIATNRAVAGKYDFIGVAEHEITEVMGRGYDLNYNGGAYIPFDLFRVTNRGSRSFGLTDQGVYFSVDGGLTAVKYFYTNYNDGDLQDWLSSTPPDAYDAFCPWGEQLNLTPADFTALDILGYNAPMATFPLLARLQRTGSLAQISFTNTTGATFSVLYNTKVTAALTNWAFLGMATQTTAGHFLFTDPGAGTNKTGFYRIRSP